ncbi:hypothetical protein L1787_11265 [Acuticoccus sp. M5D2P5]|uniref:hypothetical protein n=1 Tax=Acuticoccus kalidii TaxID=2910977 RepID=UPI001F20B98D|nr:hypothetical protein [Acuticoccus kalidii]MCF3933997.1 hypothetical protein [Acuticoccus kalidii]
MVRFAFAVIAIVWPSLALSGAWTLERGETKTFVASSFTYGENGFDEDGKLVSVPEYRKFELTGRFEYGVRPWLTAIAIGELRQESVETELSPTLIAPVSTSFGGVAGGARLRLHKAPSWVFSTEVKIVSGGFDADGTSAPADGPALDARALVGVGGKVLGKHTFADIQAGYRVAFRSDDADEVNIDLTVGRLLTPRWMVLAQTFSTFEVGGSDVQFHKVSGSVVRQVTERLQVEVTGLATVYGRNALQEFGGKLGFWYTF